MQRFIFALYLSVTLLSAATATAQDVSEAGKTGPAQTVNKGEQHAVKELSGMSIVGNDEAPKSLYIVPWKSSALGVEASLDTMMNEDDVPVDRDVFKRQLEFFRISTQK